MRADERVNVYRVVFLTMTRLTVAVRVRPLSEREITNKSVSIVSVEDGKTIAVTNTKVPEQNAGDSRERVRRFHFDYCFNYAARQEDVYEKLGAEIVKGVRQRVHSCILAYGQSATGKTHTMLGDGGGGDEEGVVPRLCRHFFAHLEDIAIGGEREHICATVSFLEIYNERVRDLLNHEANILLKVREHPQSGPYVQGLSEQSVSDAGALLSLLHAGNANRTIGATNANPRSSRSHSVFTITCLGGLKLRFVDLAGSERATATVATATSNSKHTASRFREGANINKSLVALRNVISALADWSKLSKVKKRFVPYRDSVLTWLLKDTLGGNSKTILISTVSPASTCYNETVNTLRFGQRAKQIAIQPLLNEDPKERTIRELRAEIAKLRELLLHNNVNRPLSIEEPPLKEDHIETKNEETDNDNDSDSGISVIQEKPKVTCSETQESYVEKIYPLIDVTDIKMAEDKPKPLQRTFSVDHPIDSSKKPIPRKLSTDKSNLSLKTSTLTSTSKKADPKPKVDSHRRVTPKPRSQIVAAVTQRLYNKVKKKEVATDTLDLNLTVPYQELSITSKARSRLQELTQKALRAHRRKNAETQTSLFPVLRFKEAGTDVNDLRLLSEEIANIDTSTDAILLCDASTNCAFLDTLQSFSEEEKEIATKQMVLTRSCGTITDPLIETLYQERKVPEEKPSLSFTKYLMPQQQPSFEIVNPATANPIYTSSVNINVNHNYTTVGNGVSGSVAGCVGSKPLDALSDDSLEFPTDAPHGNVCFPTPDLISNHNSLEQTCTNLAVKQGYDASSATTTTIGCESDMRYAITTSMPIEEPTINLNTNSLNTMSCNNVAVASCSMEMGAMETKRISAQVQTQYAPEMCVGEVFDDDYDIFYKAPPQKYRSNIARDHLHDPVHPHVPTILKSIMKCSDDFDEDDHDDNNSFDNIPDSLNYYYEKNRKTVRFDSPTSNSSSSNSSTSSSSRHKRRSEKDEKMMDVMTGFMKEVTTLMTNLSKVANRLDNNACLSSATNEAELNYDMQVTINGINGIDNYRCDCTSLPNRDNLTESTQTLPVSTSDCSTSTTTEILDDFSEIPVNKFEALLESSCKRLESTIQRTLSTNERRDVFVRQHYNQEFYRNVEDSSLESQPTFSDYGSLPRRRNRGFTSPSSYLRQLTNMRREIVRTSRDELLQEADLHL